MDEPEAEDGLIRRSRAGDPVAFEALVRAHQCMIHAMTFRMTGSIEDAEDLAQETFIQAFRNLDQFAGQSRFSSWLCRIAINRCLNWRQRAQRESRLAEAWRRETEAAAEGAVDCATEAEIGARVQAALLRLKPAYRAAVALTMCEGLTHAEAACALGCSVTTVSWRLFLARGTLKRLLGGPPHAASRTTLSPVRMSASAAVRTHEAGGKAP